MRLGLSGFAWASRRFLQILQGKTPGPCITGAFSSKETRKLGPSSSRAPGPRSTGKGILSRISEQAEDKNRGGQVALFVAAAARTVKSAASESR